MRPRLTCLLLFFGLLTVPLFASADSIKGVIGGAAACCPPPPSLLTSLCTGASSCPRQTRPSFTDPNRMWGSALGGSPACQTSTNGGATWGLCTTQPFTSGGKENYAGAANGNVVATGRVGADCRISTSANNGATWTLRFTGVGVPCGGSLSGPTQLSCFSNGSCTFIFNDGMGHFEVLRSTNNGEGWASVFTSATSVSSLQALAFNLTTLTAVPPASIGFRGVECVGGTCSSSAAWAAGSSCWGAFLSGGAGFGVCYSGTGSVYHIRNIAFGALVNTPSLPDAVALVDSGGPSVGLTTNPLVIYTIAAIGGPTRVRTYRSLDGGASYQTLATSSVAGSGVREADFWEHPLNRCVYWSTANEFARIC